MKHILNRLRKDYNISVIESGLHDSRDWTEITATIVAMSSGEIDAIFESVERDVAQFNGLEITDSEKETW